jgi:exopolysaccharide biosynthesis polyprenyl glycosylphosphotransferase
MSLKPTLGARRTGEVSQTLCFRYVHLLFDLAALALAWRMTLELRLLLNPYMPIAIPRELMPALAFRLTALLPLWVLASLWLNTYGERSERSIVAALLRVMESTLVVSMLAVVLTFFSRQFGLELSRSFVLLFAPVCLICLTVSLALSIRITNGIEGRWRQQTRLAVLGSGTNVEELVRPMIGALGSSVSFHGLILSERATTAAEGSNAGVTLPVLGTTGQLAALINRECLDRIIVVPGSLTESEFEYYGELMKRMGVTVSSPILGADSGVLVKHRVESGMHLIDLEPAPSSSWEDIIKRAMDAAAALALITLLLPLFAVLTCLVRFTSKGPVFFRSQRVGKGGRYFTFWKFRSMYINGPARTELMQRNESSGHVFKIRRDPRVTPVGRVMRRLSLDELPQLFNVLAGDMSLVGPRPLPAEDLGLDGMSRTYAEWAQQRSLVRPGITGLWQIRGRSDLSFAQMVELDLEYVRNWSLSLDISILLETPRAVFLGRGAY